MASYKGTTITPGTDAQVAEQVKNIDLGISTGSLKGAAPIALTQPKPSTAAAGALGAIGANTSAFTEDLMATAKQRETAATNSFDAYLSAAKGASGEVALTDQAYSQSVDPLESELKDINQQLTSEQVALQRRLEALDKNPGGLFGGALTDEKARIERDSLRKQADLSVIQLAKQGKYDSAKAIADRAVAAQIETKKNELDALRVTYERNSDLFDKSETRAFETLLSDRERELNMTAEKELYRYKAMIDGKGTSGSYSTATSQSFEDYLAQRESELGLNIDPSSSLYTQIKDDYQKQSAGGSSDLMASNVRSLVAKTGPAAAIFDRSYAAAAANGPESAKAFLRAQYINNVLSGTERENYNNVNNGIANYDAAIKFLEANPDLNTGFYKETAEGLKPKLTANKDPRYTTLINLINQAESPIRKSLYGTAITPTEAVTSQRSLLNTDDDRATVLLKMRQNSQIYRDGLDRSMANALGTPFTPTSDYTGTDDEALFDSTVSGGGGNSGFLGFLGNAFKFGAQAATGARF